MKKFLIFMLLIPGALCQGISALEVTYKTIEVLGTGSTRDEAVLWAQINAIQMVTGTSISASMSAQEGLSSDNTGSRTYQKSFVDVSKETAGVIRASEIKSTLYNKELEEWNAILIVTVLDLERAAGRKTIAVSDLRSEKRNFRAFARDLTGNLKSKLTASRKFSVIEQNLGKKFRKELDAIIENPLLSLTEKVIVKNGLPPDLVLVGKVESVSLKLNEIAPSSDLIRIKIPDVSARINYQIIDVYTSETKFHDLARVNLTQADFVGRGQTVNEGNIGSLSADIIGTRIVDKILNAIYPVILTSISEDNQASLNFGSEFNKEGDVFEIYRRGDRIYDPYTEEVMTWEESFMGEVKVTRTLPKVSFGEISGNEQDLNRIREELTERSRQFVAYKIAKSSASSSKIKKKVRKEISEEKKALEEEF